MAGALDWAHEQHAIAGFDLARTEPVIEAYKSGVDRTLLHENLRLTPAERIEKMIAALRGVSASKDLERVAELEALRAKRERTDQ